ncbi:MAG: leucine-rich repeat domain-containing protein [Bacteroidales bacterium]|nr:leucine-rich repeat domain-containing protein [Bacteroidales bacterium]
MYALSNGTSKKLIDDSFYSISTSENGDIWVTETPYTGSHAAKQYDKDGKLVKTYNTSNYPNAVNQGNYHNTSNISGNITIPSNVIINNKTYSVKSIAKQAFSGCTGLTSITIPSSVTYIGEEAFSGYTGLASISINGDVDVSNAELYFIKDGLRYHVLDKNSMEIVNADYSGNIVIPANVTAGNTFSVVGISERAFYNYTALSSITIPESVTSIKENAFYGCEKLTKVTCLATTPPTINSNSFANYNSYLYVLCESKDAYDLHSEWGSFKYIECIGSEEVDLQKDEVVVEPERTAAVFTMPQNESANSYTLTIQNNGVTFCTLTFNAQGQLSNIDFSTTKSYELKAGVSAYQFTVTGLSEATDYGYSFKALSSSKSVLKEYTGSFTTQNADGTGGSSQGGAEVEGGSGQGGEGGEQGGSTAINGVSNATTVTIENNQILVNGEAPAFVVTVSGKKIVNLNLNSGVYFVNVEGKTVKVSVK